MIVLLAEWISVDLFLLDPLGRLAVTAGCEDHLFHTCRPSVPTFQNLSKNFHSSEKVVAPGEPVGLAEWIIDDLFLLFYMSSLEADESGSIGSGTVWSDPDWLGERADFRPDPYPALLRIHDVGRDDAGEYRCRVDFMEAPTRTSLVNLTVIGEFLCSMFLTHQAPVAESVVIK